MLGTQLLGFRGSGLRNVRGSGVLGSFGGYSGFGGPRMKSFWGCMSRLARFRALELEGCVRWPCHRYEEILMGHVCVYLCETWLARWSLP